MALSGILAGAKIRLYKSRTNEGLFFKGNLSKQEKDYGIYFEHNDWKQRQKLLDVSWKLAHLIAQGHSNTMRAGFLLPKGAFHFAEHIIDLEKLLPAGISLDFTRHPHERGLPRELILSNPRDDTHERWLSLEDHLTGKPVEYAVGIYAGALGPVLNHVLGKAHGLLTLDLVTGNVRMTPD